MTETPSQLIDKYKWSAFVETAGDDEDLIRAALEEQVYSFGWNKDDAEGVVAGALASGEGIKKALEVYTGKYSKALGNMRMGQFLDAEVYGNTLRDFLGENSPEYQRATREFERFSEENYSDILKKIKKAEAIKKNAKALGLSDDDVEQAKDTLKKYERVRNILNTLELNKLDALRPKIRKRATKASLADILRE